MARLPVNAKADPRNNREQPAVNLCVSTANFVQVWTVASSVIASYASGRVDLPFRPNYKTPEFRRNSRPAEAVSPALRPF
jgi:hypothetical protein